MMETIYQNAIQGKNTDIDLSTMTREQLDDLIIMMFHIRDIHAGLGRRQLFYDLFIRVYLHDKKLSGSLLKFIPHYGCWRDVFQIMKMCPELEFTILSMTKRVFISDCVNTETPSLLAKWLPREKSKAFPGMARKLAVFFFPMETSVQISMMRYRKQVSALNRRLGTREVAMCALHTCQPGLNEVAMCAKKSYKPRMTVSDALKKFVKKPHHALQLYSQPDFETLCNQSEQLTGFANCIAMCDVSQYYNRIPIPIGLSLLIAETNPLDGFRNKVLLVDEYPRWYSFSDFDTLSSKVDSLARHAYVENDLCDFYRAYMVILNTLYKCKTPIGEEPAYLFVFSDMDFETANYRDNPTNMSYVDKWKIQSDKIAYQYRRVCEEIHGFHVTAWKPPHFVLWDVDATYVPYSKQITDGVTQISGWHPEIFYKLQRGGVGALRVETVVESILRSDRYTQIRA
jgi:hypothetical protein